jgi:hypothetical protein
MSGGGGAMGVVPVSTRKLVQGLNEIVNCPDVEIYAALRECDMDLDEVVSCFSPKVYHLTTTRKGPWMSAGNPLLVSARLADTIYRI